MTTFVRVVTATRTSSRAPLVFVVTTTQGLETPQYRGTSIRTDGKWIAGATNSSVVPRIKLVYPASVLEFVQTDDEIANLPRIRNWIDRECTRVHSRAKHDCLVISSQSYTPYRSSMDPYDFKKTDAKKRVSTKTDLLERIIVALRTPAPTIAITSSPSIPSKCLDRSSITCEITDACEYVGSKHGCRDRGYCGFETKIACVARNTCEFVRERCRKRKK